MSEKHVARVWRTSGGRRFSVAVFDFADGTVLRTSRGFTVLELLISAGIVLAIMSVAVVVVGQARAALDRDGMGVESAQRLRAGLDVLTRELRDAGASGGSAAASGALAHALPPVELLRSAAADGGREDRFVAIRVTTSPVAAARAVTREAIAPGTVIPLRPPPACSSLPACGFRVGSMVVIYDGSGAFDRVAIEAIDPVNGSLAVRPAVSRPYPVGTSIGEVEMVTIELARDASGTATLVRHSTNGAAQPLVDHVALFRVEAMVDAMPPAPGPLPASPPTYGPRPPPPDVDDLRDAWPAGENCTMARGADDGLVSRLALRGGSGGLVRLSLAQLQDGPWCPGASGVAYDADLFRVRRLDVRLRVEAASARLRGPAGALFTRAGHAQPLSWVPDLEMRFSVWLPNMAVR